jgi:hypothetical protein
MTASMVVSAYVIAQHSAVHHSTVHNLARPSSNGIAACNCVCPIQLQQHAVQVFNGWRTSDK